MPRCGRFSGYVSYANQSGLGEGPITGGLLIGSDANNALTDTSKFSVSQDHGNSLCSRVRFQAARHLWFAAATQYGSELPAEVGDNPDVGARRGHLNDKSSPSPLLESKRGGRELPVGTYRSTPRQPLLVERR